MEFSDPPQPFALGIGTSQEILVVMGVKELSAANSEHFLQMVRSAILPEHRSIEIDLSQTKFVDSCGLGTFISLRNTMMERCGTVRLLNPTPFVQQLLSLTRFDHLFDCVVQHQAKRSEPASNQIVDSV